MEAVKESFDKDTIMASVMKKQVEGLRSQIKSFDDQYHLKKISQNHYVRKKKQLLVDIQETGATLTPEESEWLELNFDQSKGHISEETGSKYMGIAGKNIKSLQ
jgi:hypothetical protein